LTAITAAREFEAEERFKKGDTVIDVLRIGWAR
jgi:hypothetical protein